MKKKHATLRFKLTAITALVMVAMCAALAAITIKTSGIIVQASEVMPSVSTDAINTTAPLPAQSLTPATATEAQKSFNVITLLSMLAVIIGGCAFLYFFVRRELRPLEELSAQLRELGADNLAAAVSVRATGDEVEQLALAINDMATRVNDAYLMQKSFAQNAAHELRTPLAVMQTKIDVFKLKQEHTSEEYSGLVEVMNGSTYRLAQLVAQLLELTNNAVTDMAQCVDLRALCDEAAMDLAPLAVQRNIDIAVDGKGEVYGNDCLLQRMIFNIMQNAVKYNVQGGNVQVALTQRDKQAVLTVADTGVGIADAEKFKVFDLFYRTDKSRSRELGGNGLGLAIVKRIALQHNAQISIKNNAPRGAIVEVIFCTDIR